MAGVHPFGEKHLGKAKDFYRIKVDDNYGVRYRAVHTESFTDIPWSTLSTTTGYQNQYEWDGRLYKVVICTPTVWVANNYDALGYPFSKILNGPITNPKCIILLEYDEEIP